MNNLIEKGYLLIGKTYACVLNVYKKYNHQYIEIYDFYDEQHTSINLSMYKDALFRRYKEIIRGSI